LEVLGETVNVSADFQILYFEIYYVLKNGSFGLHLIRTTDPMQPHFWPGNRGAFQEQLLA
jgi:hypothetical protein